MSTTTPYDEWCVGCIEGDHDECTGMWTEADTGRERDCMCRHDTHDPAAESGSADTGPSSVSQGRSGRPGRSHECQENVCCGCGDDGPDIAAVHVWDEQHGFCTLSCMVGYVRGRWLLSPSQLAGVRP